jgi:DeoR/GlpR family transcriptional regulator of sugar metabolism
VDLCLLGTNSLSVEEGVTDSDWEVVQIKKAMIKSSQKLGVLSIVEKLNSNQKLRVCQLKDITYLITDLNPKHPSLEEFSKQITVI